MPQISVTQPVSPVKGITHSRPDFTTAKRRIAREIAAPSSAREQDHEPVIGTSPFDRYSRLDLERWLVGCLYSPLLTPKEARQLIRRLRVGMFRPSLQPFVRYALSSLLAEQIPLDQGRAIVFFMQETSVKPTLVSDVLDAAYEVVTLTGWPRPVQRLQEAYYWDRLLELIHGTDSKDPTAIKRLRRALQALEREQAAVEEPGEMKERYLEVIRALGGSSLQKKGENL